MNKRFAIVAFAAFVLLSGCAADITDTSADSQSTGTVPGEKIPGEQTLAPAPGGRSGGTMSW